jgi:PTH1 family peptidyl-tRNA hydrolase
LKLIVGLGNPGVEHRQSRHNIGFHVAQAFAGVRHMSVWRRRFLGKYMSGDGWSLLLPLTYMNLSGLAVAKAARILPAQPEEILVLHDDVDITLGQLRFKHGGSSGGHKGLESIIGSLGDSGFDRLRFGVGREGNMKALDFILDPFNSEDEVNLPILLEHAVEGIRLWLDQGVEVCMNHFNRRNFLSP